MASARILAAPETMLLDTAVYHCQQAAEKAVKGFLVFCDHEVPRTHDIEVLVQAAAVYEGRFSEWLEPAGRLTPYATRTVSKFPMNAAKANSPCTPIICWKGYAAVRRMKTKTAKFPPEQVCYLLRNVFHNPGLKHKRSGRGCKPRPARL
ncbi:MAG: HEPN domain-containing protein [Gammaproteobacteria bacterium]|nr:HEPN domain-containing protein [Gammaproteobacteria bacterium]